jgi:hypothetical protein
VWYLVSQVTQPHTPCLLLPLPLLLLGLEILLPFAQQGVWCMC